MSFMPTTDCYVCGCALYITPELPFEKQILPIDFHIYTIPHCRFVKLNNFLPLLPIRDSIIGKLC